MLIDWFTVIAQAVNFIVLMCLLKRFLYKPILNAIDAREAHIAETVRTAESEKREAEAEHRIFTEKNAEFERRRADLLSQARDEAKTAGEQLLDKERQNVDAMRRKWRDALADEQARFGDETAHRVQEEVFATVRQVLADLSDTSLEQRIVEVFDRRLREAWKAPDDRLAAALRTAPKSVRVRSAFDLPPETRESLQKTLGEMFAPGAEIRFETKPDLIGGVELVVDGQRVVWAMSDYLAGLKTAVTAPQERA